MYPFPLDRFIRPMSLPVRQIHSLVFVRGDARRSYLPDNRKEKKGAQRPFLGLSFLRRREEKR